MICKGNVVIIKVILKNTNKVNIKRQDMMNTDEESESLVPYVSNLNKVPRSCIKNRPFARPGHMVQNKIMLGRK